MTRFDIKEEVYIYYRCIKAFLCRIVYLLIAAFCPIQQNKIVFSSFEGNGYGCNPKYIAEEIICRDKGDRKNHELVWLVDDITKEFPPEIKNVRNTLWNRAYHLSTAKIWIDNSRKKLGTRKRKGQYYFQTWHGAIGIKPEGRRRGASFSVIVTGTGFLYSLKRPKGLFLVRRI